MSIYARVNAEYEKHFASRSDDYDTKPIIDSLTPEELELWLAECEVEDELRPEHGMKPDFYDILEHEIYARGIEVAPHFGPSSGETSLPLNNSSS